jgi:hypothetical protein
MNSASQKRRERGDKRKNKKKKSCGINRTNLKAKNGPKACWALNSGLDEPTHWFRGHIGL